MRNPRTFVRATVGAGLALALIAFAPSDAGAEHGRKGSERHEARWDRDQREREYRDDREYRRQRDHGRVSRARHDFVTRQRADEQRRDELVDRAIETLHSGQTAQARRIFAKAAVVQRRIEIRRSRWERQRRH